MGKCILCGNLSNNKEKATLHKFPREEKLHKEWLKRIGLERLRHPNSNVLCSDHFTEDCFVVHFNNRKRLKPGCVPTILAKEVTLQKQQDVLVKTNCTVTSFPNKVQGMNIICDTENQDPQRNILMEINCTDNDVPPSSIIKEIPGASVIVDYSDIPTTSKEIISQEKYFSLPSTAIKPDSLKEKNEPSTAHRIVYHDHCYEDSPSTKKRKLENLHKELDLTRKENKILKQTVGRLKKKVNSLTNVVEDLKHKKFLPESAYYCLSAHEDISLELFNRMIKNRKNRDKLTRDKYPPSLRAFALTVHFYSPKAYMYIRKTFDLALPHPDVLRTWYSSVDAVPGFTEESFETLKLKSNNLKEKGKKLLCAVVIDEMGIKKGCQRGRDGKIRGHVDLGVGTSDGDDLLEARNAVVIMVVMLETNCKLPIGYFLVNSLTAETKANLLREAFIRLQKAGVTVCSLTLDGPSDHFAAVELLGARMHIDPKNKKTENLYDLFKVNFSHPVPGEPDINVIFDACHMLKNIRNCLGDYKILIDPDGNKIEWRYLQQLALLQESEGLRLGNRLHTKHIEFRKMVMKVSLAAQTLSSSVADSIEFCSKVLQIPEFKGCEATARFLRCIDIIFDFLNVRNPWGKHLKSPLKRNNEDVWRPRLISEITYLSKLKEENGTPIFRSRRKAGFIGFFTAVLATFKIFDINVKPSGSQLSYLLTYKTSQDHLELFFCAIRGRSGWCPNPTVSQFVSAFKRLLIRNDIFINTGNVTAMDNTKILHVSSGERKKQRAKLDRYDLKIYDSVHTATVAEKYGLTNHSIDDSDFSDSSEFLNFSWAQSPNISEFSQQAIGYISGWVILSIKKKKKIKCLECLVVCEEMDKNNISIHQRNPTAYIAAITRGYLLIPSRSVTHICMTTESLFRRACNRNFGKPPVESNFPAILATRVFQKVVEEYNLFPELESHNIDMFSAEEFISHTNKLIKTIISSYIELRLYAETKKHALSITGTNMRHFLTRSIVWAHQ